jgi:hypothetical protein
VKAGDIKLAKYCDVCYRKIWCFQKYVSVGKLKMCIFCYANHIEKKRKKQKKIRREKFQKKWASTRIQLLEDLDSLANKKPTMPISEKIIIFRRELEKNVTIEKGKKLEKDIKSLITTSIGINKLFKKIKTFEKKKLNIKIKENLQIIKHELNTITFLKDLHKLEKRYISLTELIPNRNKSLLIELKLFEKEPLPIVTRNKVKLIREKIERVVTSREQKTVENNFKAIQKIYFNNKKRQENRKYFNNLKQQAEELKPILPKAVYYRLTRNTLAPGIYKSIKNLNKIEKRIIKLRNQYSSEYLDAEINKFSGIDDNKSQLTFECKPYQCEYCDDQFVLKHLLEEHIKSAHPNFGIEDYDAKACKKIYMDKYRFVCHLNKPNSDERCAERFRTKKQLKKHYEIQHHKKWDEEKARYLGSFVGHSYKQQAMFDGQLKRKGAFPCLLCGRKFDTRYEANMHAKSGCYANHEIKKIIEEKKFKEKKVLQLQKKLKSQTMAQNCGKNMIEAIKKTEEQLKYAIRDLKIVEADFKKQSININHSSFNNFC